MEIIERKLKWVQIDNILPSYMAISKTAIHIVYYDEDWDEYYWEMYEPQYLMDLLKLEPFIPVTLEDWTGKKTVHEAIEWVENHLYPEELQVSKELQNRFINVIKEYLKLVRQPFIRKQKG